jgi:hypothetical protein
MVRSRPIRPDYGAALRGDGLGLARAALAVIQGTRTQVPVVELARRNWPDDPIPDIILRAPSQAASVGTPAWAGVLAQTALAFVTALTPLSAGAALFQLCLQLSFDSAGKILVPSVALPLADFVGEAQAIPALQGTSTTGADVEPAKFGVIVALSRELYENAGAVNLIQAALVESAAPSLDRRLFDSNPAVAELRPAGLLNGIVALPASAATDLQQAMISDLSALANAVSQRAGNADLIYIMAPRQAIAASFALPKPLPYPILTSTQLADGTVIAVVPNAIAVAMGLMRIDTSTQASWHKETNAQPIVSDTGVVATPVGSSFQTDNVTLRMKWPLSWARRANDAVAFVSAAKWPG